MKLKSLANFKDIIPFLSHTQSRGENIIILSPKNLLFTLNVLKQHINFQYKLLSCISGVDFLNLKYRFGVVYDLLSLSYNTRLRLKVLVNETTPVSSVVSIYRNAD
jgi:NADH:ubiquinone oxidoreductase subunit C